MRYVANEGTVEVTQEGPLKYITAELGINMQLKTDNPVKMKVVAWNTRERDFAQTKDLFACHSAQLDLSDLRLTFDGKEATADKRSLVYQTEDAQQRGDTCEVITE